jgi:hypothetical protein
VLARWWEKKNPASAPPLEAAMLIPDDEAAHGAD